MVHIKVKRGLDIPIEAGPENSGEHIGTLHKPKEIAYDFTSFEEVKLRPLVKAGDEVKIGQPLCEDKDVPGRMFTSPAAGVVFDVRRGEKRKLLAIIITVAEKEEYVANKPLAENPSKVAQLSKDTLVSALLAGGLFAHIRSRPFNLLANPAKPARSIFVKAIESAPFLPSAELQVLGKEHEFQVGLAALKKLTEGPVHLVFRHDTTCRAFLEAQGVEKHTVQGPHPAANVSLHINAIDPIKRVDDVVWTVNTLDVIAIGHFLIHGKIATDRVVSIAGEMIAPQKRGYFRARVGHSIESLVEAKLAEKHNDLQHPIRLISGDVLTGDKVELTDFLGFSHTSLCALSDTTSRQFLHFFRLGKDKYTASGAYLSGHLNPHTHKWSFTTSQHGEERAFIDGSVYERVMPLPVLPMQLIRALLSQDFELAEFHGLLEVDAEDFALPEFVCPSKIEMMNIVKSGLQQYAKDSLG
mgnify:CR=1 FL=1